MKEVKGDPDPLYMYMYCTQTIQIGHLVPSLENWSSELVNQLSPHTTSVLNSHTNPTEQLDMYMWVACTIEVPWPSDGRQLQLSVVGPLHLCGPPDWPHRVH